MGRTVKYSCQGMEDNELANAIAEGAKVTLDGVEMPDGTKKSEKCKITPSPSKGFFE